LQGSRAIISRREGFTLIELLVVVAVVAILMALAFPTLLGARRQAQSVACRSNLRQLGSAFQVYAGDHGGCMPSTSRAWQSALGLLSYDKRNELLFCPRARRFPSEGGQHPFVAYNAFSFGDASSGDSLDGGLDVFAAPDVYVGYGSYGLNGWVCNPPTQARVNPRGLSTTSNWRRMDVKGIGAVPLLLDASWMDGHPHHTDPPPSFGQCPSDPSIQPLSVPGGMDVFCLNRHERFVSGVFLDLSARRIGLKGLWKLKWHRTFETAAPRPDWPEWMQGFPGD